MSTHVVQCIKYFPVDISRDFFFLVSSVRKYHFKCKEMKAHHSDQGTDYRKKEISETESPVTSAVILSWVGRWV